MRIIVVSEQQNALVTELSSTRERGGEEREREREMVITVSKRNDETVNRRERKIGKEPWPECSRSHLLENMLEQIRRHRAR